MDICLSFPFPIETSRSVNETGETADRFPAGSLSLTKIRE